MGLEKEYKKNIANQTPKANYKERNEIYDADHITITKKRLIYRMTMVGKSLTILWVQHKGIPGNEKADKLANMYGMVRY